MRCLFILIFVLYAVTASSQIRSSVKDGDFYDISTWDCWCIPNYSDTVIINHTININADLLFGAESVIIESNGVLKDNVVGRTLYFYGGQLHNYGILDCFSLLVEGGDIINYSTMNLDSIVVDDKLDNYGNISVI